MLSLKPHNRPIFIKLKPYKDRQKRLAETGQSRTKNNEPKTANECKIRESKTTQSPTKSIYMQLDINN